MFLTNQVKNNLFFTFRDFICSAPNASSFASQCSCVDGQVPDAATISDEGLLKACFMARGNMTICTEDEDLSIDLGEWDANDDQSKAHFARACGVTMDVANEVAGAS